MITSGVVFITRVPYLTMDHMEWNGCATETRVKLVGWTSAVSAWNKKQKRPGLIATIVPDPSSPERVTRDRTRKFWLKISPPVGRRTPKPGLPTRWVCYDPPVGKVRTVFAAQSPAGSAYLVSAAEPYAARSRSGKNYRNRRMPALAR